MRDFNQCHIGPHIQFFGKAFMKRWNFIPYTDGNKPVVFFGINGQHELINNHKGPKIIITSGPEDLPDWNILKNRKNLFLLSSVDKLNKPIPSDVIFKREMIEMKDFSMFKPNVLGNKIYAYTGTHSWSVNHYLRNELQKYLPYELIYKTHNSVNDYYDLKYLKENYYDKSFMCINLHAGFGMTTVRELALMGRKVAMNPINYTHSFGKACLPFELNHPTNGLVNIIKKEAKKIGTIQPSINLHTQNNDKWLYLDYYVNNNTIKPYKNKNTVKLKNLGKYNIIADDVIIEDGVKIGNFNTIASGTIIKKGAVIGNYCEIGKNNVIGENSILQGRIRTASGCIFEKNVTTKYGTILTSDVLLKEGCFLGPHTITLGSTHERITKHGTVIGKNTYIGAGSKIAADTKIGDDIVIGALGFVNKDLTTPGIYAGLPVKFIKKNKKK
tara:strand:- start:1896 stop:3221 length:1326 start_codon:yes stop_codon:yes gene_type:complete